MPSPNTLLSAGGSASVPAGPGSAPGRGIGIAGFVLSILGAFSPIGLVLSAVALVQGRRVGRTNGLAVAGVVLGAIGTALLIGVTVVAVSVLSAQFASCRVSDLIRDLGCAL